MSCPPKRATIPLLPADPCVRLAMIEAALYMLASGEKRAEVRHGEHFLRYNDGSVPFLERERNRLAAICPTSGAQRSAITIERTPVGVHPIIPNRYRRGY